MCHTGCYCSNFLHLVLNPYLVQWIASYLCQRQQAVCVEGSSSSYLPVLSGVPQGSVLGPLLFLTYIDEVSEVNISDSSLLLYADDIVIYRTIRSSGDYLHLQNDVNALTDCVSSSLLNLNPAKCKYMIITRKHQSIPGPWPGFIEGGLC